MNKLLAWILIIAAAAGTIALGVLIMVWLRIGGNFFMLVVVGCAFTVGTYVYQRLQGVLNTPTSKESRIYPIVSDSFPIDHLFIGDNIIFEDGRNYRYTGSFEGKYGFEGPQFLELTADEVMNQAKEFGNNRITKWKCVS